MKPALRALAWIANGAVCASGAAYAWCLYCCEPADPLAVVNHPLQPLAQEVHVLGAPVWLFALGVLWAAHAVPRLARRGGPRRRTGFALVATAAPVGLSGYLLQVAVDETWRTLWLVVHLASAVVWLTASVWHVAARRR